MAKTYVTKTPQADMPTLDDQTLLVSFMVHMFGSYRSLDDDDYDIHAGDDEATNRVAKRDTTAIRKRFADGVFPELKAVVAHLNETKRWFKQRALPSYLRVGVYRLSVAAVDGVIAGLQQRERELATLLDAFEVAYPAAVEVMRTRHAAIFDESNYPEASAARSEFGFSYRFMASGVPKALAKINEAVYADQQRRYTELLQQTQQRYILLMREAVADVVGHMAERLAPNPDGTRKRMAATLVPNFREFVETFPLRNVANDNQLAALVAQLDSMFAGVVDTATLKDDDDLRDELARQTSAIKAVADKLVVAETQGRRRLVL